MGKSKVKLVGHRGLPQYFPENSLLGIDAALQAGADAVEFDVQVSRDGVPIVLHDVDLQRVAGLDRRASDMAFSELVEVSAHEMPRLGATFDPTPVPSLLQMVELLVKWPEARVFLELKAEIFETEDRLPFVQQVLQIVQPLGRRCVIISFDLPVLRCVQSCSNLAVGWVLTDYSDSEHRQMQAQSVEYLICNLRKVPQSEGALWPGPWSWFMYDIVQAPDLQRCVVLEVEFVETWDARALRKLLEAM